MVKRIVVQNEDDNDSESISSEIGAESEENVELDGETQGLSLAQRARRALNKSMEKEEKISLDSASEELEQADLQESMVEELEAALDGEEVDTQSPPEGLEAALAASQAEAQENYDKYIRSVAEFENFKKRNAKERSDMLRYAGEHLARDLLEIVDDLARASSSEVGGTAEEIQSGVRLINERFVALLQNHQIKGEEAVGEVFDPNKHEALTTVPTTEHPEGVVIEQLRKAYFFKDKLLRPAQVVVSARPASEEAKEGDDNSEEDAAE
jgi:molecular chaperone GrpE